MALFLSFGPAKLLPVGGLRAGSGRPLDFRLARLSLVLELSLALRADLALLVVLLGRTKLLGSGVLLSVDLLLGTTLLLGVTLTLSRLLVLGSVKGSLGLTSLIDGGAGPPRLTSTAGRTGRLNREEVRRTCRSIDLFLRLLRAPGSEPCMCMGIKLSCTRLLRRVICSIVELRLCRVRLGRKIKLFREQVTGWFPQTLFFRTIAGRQFMIMLVFRLTVKWVRPARIKPGALLRRLI